MFSDISKNLQQKILFFIAKLCICVYNIDINIIIRGIFTQKGEDYYEV